ncbi:TolC family protein [Pseudoalteromonas sp. SSDWG2]|uniref:TolC family protein n=1 Tax=Pseudoalteromonas sp. SSDWG2 TaxID=3139391 RepID=UPI003BA99468
MKACSFRTSTIVLGLTLGLSSPVALSQQKLSLEQAIMLAHQNDPWLEGNRLQQQAIEHKSIASGTLPDPTVSVGLMNMPVDTWSFEQEGMTQLKVGVTQMFPRGDSLDITQNKLQLQSSQYPLLRANRKAQLQSQVSQLWLDAYLANRTIELIKADRVLFEQIAEVAQASYASAIGKTRQQDVIRAQLEIVQLEDRLTVEQQKLETSLAALNEWLQEYDQEAQALNFDVNDAQHTYSVADALPAMRLSNGDLLAAQPYNRSAVAAVIASHPALMAIDVKQQVSAKDVELAQQSYKPQWGVNASYGYRGDMPSGDSRADFFSVGVSFDLPLFTQHRQDKQVAASVAQTEAVKTEKLLLMKQMLSAIEKEMKQIVRLKDRKSLYENQLLKQTYDQAQAALTAYTNDDGDFAEVVRARIAELNARISALKIDVDLLKTVARINYFFTRYEPQHSNEGQSQHNHLSGEQ